ncbi:reelin domain-containing protein 1-like [Eriocheir sinensis]|uniref:reelin domain-containing protein 1-like n=1 Tax=Eriocheir sinensis TaxID=95602 RepID=UPI0021C7DED4|nr:reelin domain-containing protein 1-like [Eriocheir sinensis]
MYASGALAVFLAVVVVVWGPCSAFPDGAPIEACIYGNKPNHYGTKPQPRHTMKLNFLASDSYYEPGSVIYVHITGGTFKGFFVQARDAKTNKWIGTFHETKDVTVFPECSAVTHSTVPPKTEVVLAWHAPSHGQGEVYFTGTVLENYAKYWSDLVAKIPRRQG